MDQNTPLNSAERIHNLLESKEFKKLVSLRWRISIGLTSLMLFVYFGFILVLAFDKNLLATKIGEHLTLGIPVGLGMIILAWLLTGLYVQWANQTYDSRVEEFKKHLNKE